MKFGKPNMMNNKNNQWLLIGIAVILILVFAFWCTTDSFTNFKNSLTGPSLKDLDVIMFMSPECPWCKKTVEMLEKEGVKGQLEIVDIGTKEGAEYAKQYGADKQPIPSFISKKMKTGTVGYRKNVTELMKALSEVQKTPEITGENGTLVTQVQKLQIIFFSRDGCPWCTKAKESCDQAGVMDVIQVVDITTPEGKEMAGKMLPPGSSGVPAFVSMATKKSLVGFKPIDQVVEELK